MVVIVRVEVALPPAARVALFGLIVAVKPVPAGLMVTVSEIVPANPWLVMVQVDEVEPPATKLAGLNAAQLIVNVAPTVTVMVAVCEIVPLAPVTVTV